MYTYVIKSISISCFLSPNPSIVRSLSLSLSLHIYIFVCVCVCVWVCVYSTVIQTDQNLTHILNLSHISQLCIGLTWLEINAES